MNKFCPKCKIRKPARRYAKNLSRRTGLQHYCQDCNIRYCQKWRKKNPDKVREHWRNGLYRRRGITLEEFKTMLVRQSEKCLICRVVMDPPCIDHDHSTGKVRALLCGKCNTGIGQFNDRPKLLRRAADYLEQFSARAEKSNKQKQTKRK